MKTVREWLKIYKSNITNYDGFREYNSDDQMTEQTFKNCLKTCKEHDKMDFHFNTQFNKFNWCQETQTLNIIPAKKSISLNTQEIANLVDFLIEIQNLPNHDPSAN